MPPFLVRDEDGLAVGGLDDQADAGFVRGKAVPFGKGGRLHKPLQQGGLPVLRVAVDHQVQALQHLPHGLMELLLFGIPCCQVTVNLLQINAFQHDIRPFPRWF